MISIIIPVYNTKPSLLRRAVLSAVGQTYQDTEVIMVNDSSSNDDTCRCIDELKGEFPDKISLIENDRNIGISASRNLGILRAKGEWIAFIDHDDYMRDDFCERMIECAINVGVDMVVCGYECIDDCGNILYKDPLNEAIYTKDTFVYDSGVIWTRIYRKSALIDNDIFFPEGCVAEDCVFTLNCHAKGLNHAVLKYEGYVHYQNASSTSHLGSFNALNINQMPYYYLEKIAEYDSNSLCVKATIICILVILTCMQVSGSDEDTRVQAIVMAQKVLNRTDISIGLMRKYLLESEHNRAFKIMSIGYVLTHRIGLNTLYCHIVQSSMRRYYKR